MPPPGVIYENTIEKNYDDEDNLIGSTEYKFNVYESTLGGVLDFGGLDITEDELSHYDYEGDNETTETEDDWNVIVRSRTATIRNYTSTIGRLEERTIKNSFGDLLSKEKYNYYPLGELEGNAGVVQESFHSHKRYFVRRINGNLNGFYPGVTQFKFLTFSSRKFYPNVLKSITSTDYDKNVSITRLGDGSEVNNGFDFNTGICLLSETEKPNGKVLKKETTPAYSLMNGASYLYPGMQSKIYDSNNKNILAPAAYEKVSLKNIDGTWSTLSAAASEWSDTYKVRSYDFGSNPGGNYDNSTLDNDIWRVKASYVWNSEVNENGTYKSSNFNDYFDNSAGWTKASENLMYHSNSDVVENKSVNGVYSVKQYFTNDGYSDQVTLQISNSNYQSAGFTSFEYEKDNSNDIKELGGGFTYQGSGCAIINNSNLNFDSHSGLSALRISGTVVGPKFIGTVEDISNNDNRVLPGKYRTSVWVYNDPAINESIYLYVLLSFNGNTETKFVKLSDAIDIEDSDWSLLSLDFEVPENCNVGDYFAVSVSATCPDPGNSDCCASCDQQTFYIDDFIVKPLDSSGEAYVYDENGQVSAILNNDHFATYYEYDGHGRLIRIYKESVNYGKKLVQEYNYNYARGN